MAEINKLINSVVDGSILQEKPILKEKYGSIVKEIGEVMRKKFVERFGSMESPQVIFQEHLTLGYRRVRKGLQMLHFIAAALDPRMKDLEILVDQSNHMNFHDVLWQDIANILQEKENKDKATELLRHPQSSVLASSLSVPAPAQVPVPVPVSASSYSHRPSASTTATTTTIPTIASVSPVTSISIPMPIPAKDDFDELLSLVDHPGKIDDLPQEKQKSGPPTI